MTLDPQDQTRGDSTPFFQDDQPAPLSCNEAASLCMKAARGAGMSWGLAEEAGFAASWLVSQGIDGPSFLRSHLERADGKAWDDLCPNVSPATWHNAKGATVCPIILGATLSDYADLPQGLVPDDAALSLGPVSAPILLVPFLSELARKDGVEISLSWADGAITVGPDTAGLQAAAGPLGVPRLDLTLTVHKAAPRGPYLASTPNALTTAATIAALNTFAMLTTVPASEASRAGAGSTLSDND